MKGSTRIRLELRNPRFPDRELEERLSEFILYGRYAGINLDSFHEAISGAIVKYGHDGPEMKYGGKVILQTNFKTSTLINQVVQIYPVFATWEIKVIPTNKVAAPRKKAIKLKETEMATKAKPAAKKKAVAKKPVVKKKAVAKKPVVKKKAVAKKAVAKKPVAKKKAVAKKAVAKKPVAKKKAVAKKAVAKKPVAKKKAVAKKAVAKKPVAKKKAVAKKAVAKKPVAKKRAVAKKKTKK